MQQLIDGTLGVGRCNDLCTWTRCGSRIRVRVADLSSVVVVRATSHGSWVLRGRWVTALNS